MAAERQRMMPYMGALGSDVPEDTELMRFGRGILAHENLQPNQTPFRITSDKMANWNSMFDDTIKLLLEPRAEKTPSTQNFLYAKYGEDVMAGVIEQFRRYAERGMTIREAIEKFDQTGAADKISFMEDKGFNVDMPVMALFQGEGVYQPLPTNTGTLNRLKRMEE